MIRFSKPQKQEGVNMVRIKLPFGKVTFDQLETIAQVSRTFTNGNLHTTTRQDIQLHYIKHDDVEPLWQTLERSGLVDRETFGNTLRNITSSPKAGIDTKEPFDVTPYISYILDYFKNHEACSDMGRKVKIAFSSNEDDSAYGFMNDIGFVPRIRTGKRGFKVFLGGGMSGQSMIAATAFEFLPETKLINFIESVLRIFSQYGERLNRMRGRLKFLVATLGIDTFLQLVDKEMVLLADKDMANIHSYIEPIALAKKTVWSSESAYNQKHYEQWLHTNVYQQKQAGYSAVNIKLRLGNISADQVDGLLKIARKYSADNLKITSNQGIQLSYVPSIHLASIYNQLVMWSLADPGFNSTHDVTACPGTDTCNLAITNSTGLALQLEKYLMDYFDEMLYDSNIKIKISGCINACGHHTVANIGFQGTSLRRDHRTIPGMRIALGGGVDQDGKGSTSEVIMTIPTKRSLLLVGAILDDYIDHKLPKEYFNNYYKRRGKDYFRNLIFPFADLSNLSEYELIDWGDDGEFIRPRVEPRVYRPELGHVSELILEGREKLKLAEKLMHNENYADSILHTYNSFVKGAKSVLLDKGIECRSQVDVLNTYGEHYGKHEFKDMVLAYKEKEQNKEFNQAYLKKAQIFYELLIQQQNPNSLAS